MKFLFLLLSINFSLLAAPVGDIIKLKGDVTYQGKKLTKADTITGKGQIKIGPKSFVKFQVANWNSAIILGPNSQMEVNLTEPKKPVKYSLTKGVCRWKSVDKKKKSSGKLFTQQAALGVRGTDYWVKANALLGETEIVVFDGKVLMTNAGDVTDEALLKKGQWGGIGGRFGAKIAKVIDLPQNVLNVFDKVLKE